MLRHLTLKELRFRGNKVLMSLKEPPDRSKQTNVLPQEQGLLSSHYKQVPAKGMQPAVLKTTATRGKWIGQGKVNMPQSSPPMF